MAQFDNHIRFSECSIATCIISKIQTDIARNKKANNIANSIVHLNLTTVNHYTTTYTLSRPSSSSSLKITDRSFCYACPCLWNKLPASFRQPNPDHSFSHSSQPNCLSSSVPSSPLSLSITPTLSHSKLKRYFSLNPSHHRPLPLPSDCL